MLDAIHTAEGVLGGTHASQRNNPLHFVQCRPHHVEAMVHATIVAEGAYYVGKIPLRRVRQRGHQAVDVFYAIEH